MHNILLLICWVPMVVGHYHNLGMNHDHEHHHHHHGHFPGFHHENHPEHITETPKPEVKNLPEYITQNPILEAQKLPKQVIPTPKAAVENPPVKMTETPKSNINTEAPHHLKIISDGEGPSCCVEYKLCNPYTSTPDYVYNASVTGYLTLDLRSNSFTNNSGCSGMEVCCEPGKVVTSKPTDPKPVKTRPEQTGPNPETRPDQTGPIPVTRPDRTGPNPVTRPDQTGLNRKPSVPARCGIRNSRGLDFSVIKLTGMEALYGEFPWMVAVLNEGDYYGGGALIHPQVVITAAHILRGHTLGKLKIRAGEWDITSRQERLGYQEQIVKEVYFHEDMEYNNIALLLLEHPVQLDEHINVICMPNQDDDFRQYKQCVANGWGKDAFNYGKNDGFAKVLKRVELDMVENSVCTKVLIRKLGGTFSLDPAWVCAGGQKGRDTCEGDGGGPLACPIGGDQYKLSGLVMAGVSCGEEGVPALYVNVAKFRQWVDSKMTAWGLDSAIYKSVGSPPVLILRHD